MLVRRILPCQHRACNLCEFDPAKHQTLLEFFGSSHQNIWKVLFKSSKSWPDSSEDRWYQLSRPASSVSHCMLTSHTFYLHNPRETLNVFSTTLLGLDEEGGVDLPSSPNARRTNRPSSDKDVGPDALQGAKEEGREGGQRDQGRPSSPRHFGHNIRRLRCPLYLQRGQGRGGKPIPSEGKKEKDGLHTLGGRVA